MGYVPGRHMAGCIVAVHLLVVKTHISPIGPQELCFGQAAQKYRFIDTHVPRPQGSDDPLVSRCGARRHQRRTNGRMLSGQRLLQLLQ